MPIAVLNVRPSRLTSLEVIRIDSRNKDLAIGAIERPVLLYAPRDERQHGYFGLARIADVRLDTSSRRFMFVELDGIETFAEPVRLEDVAEPLESLAYRPDGSIAFSYFSPGIRSLTAADQTAIERLRKTMRPVAGMNEREQAPLGQPSQTDPRGRRTQETAIRAANLRWAVLEHYGSACAICGSHFADVERGLYEVEVCHLRGVRFGGPDEISNAMPMCRTHHWAYDCGLFTLANAGQIVVSNRMTPDLRTRFNGRSRASFPDMVLAWPRPEHLQFHREAVFRT